MAAWIQVIEDDERGYTHAIGQSEALVILELFKRGDLSVLHLTG